MRAPCTCAATLAVAGQRSRRPRSPTAHPISGLVHTPSAASSLDPLRSYPCGDRPHRMCTRAPTERGTWCLATTVGGTTSARTAAARVGHETLWCALTAKGSSCLAASLTAHIAAASAAKGCLATVIGCACVATAHAARGYSATTIGCTHSGRAGRAQRPGHGHWPRYRRQRSLGTRRLVHTVDCTWSDSRSSAHDGCHDYCGTSWVPYVLLRSLAAHVARAHPGMRRLATIVCCADGDITAGAWMLCYDRCMHAWRQRMLGTMRLAPTLGYTRAPARRGADALLRPSAARTSTRTAAARIGHETLWWALAGGRSCLAASSTAHMAAASTTGMPRYGRRLHVWPRRVQRGVSRHDHGRRASRQRRLGTEAWLQPSATLTAAAFAGHRVPCPYRRLRMERQPKQHTRWLHGWRRRALLLSLTARGTAMQTTKRVLLQL